MFRALLWWLDGMAEVEVASFTTGPGRRDCPRLNHRTDRIDFNRECPTFHLLADLLMTGQPFPITLSPTVGDTGRADINELQWTGTTHWPFLDRPAHSYICAQEMMVNHRWWQSCLCCRLGVNGGEGRRLISEEEVRGSCPPLSLLGTLVLALT